MSGPATPRLGVVIVSYNTADLLDACLRSVQAELLTAGLQDVADVVVIDNASVDETVPFVRRVHPWVRLVVADHNLGFTAANNVALRAWCGAPGGPPEHILLLNPDAALTAGALSALVAALAADPRAAVAGPALRYPDGRFQHGAFAFPGLIQTALDLWPVPRLTETRLNGRYPRRRYAAGVPFAVDFVLGACMLVRGEALAAVGPLDEAFFMYCEEIDWCRRFRRAGWRVLCVPRATAVHHGGASSGQFRSSAFVHLWQSRMTYFAKHAPAWRAALLRRLIRAGFASHDLSDARAVRGGRMAASTLAQRRLARTAVFAPGAPR